jgi:uncharacterized damage-inducible protein DinB
MIRTELEAYIRSLQFNRTKTLATLEQLEKLGSPSEVLAWRPGPARAHAAWQFMHIAVTEELFATSRLFGTEPALTPFIDRFRGGSTPDENIVDLDTIRTALADSRGHLMQAISGFRDHDLDHIPEPIKERGWSLRIVMQVMSWHESHHQGQIHITLNMWKSK